MSYMHDAIRLNQLARGLLPVEQGVAWLRSLDESEQRMLLHVAGMVAQAPPRQEDVEAAISRAGLKETFTPCVLLRKTVQNLWKLRNLPINEREKSFRLLVALLGGRQAATRDRVRRRMPAPVASRPER